MSRPSFSASPYGDTFAAAEAFLAAGKNKVSRPVANNTRMTRVDDDTIAIVLHNTAVVTYLRDGEFVIYGGGWNTVTTKARIREFSPVRVSSDGQGEWVVGYTGELTPARVQKCRTCKGRGHWMEADYCYGPHMWGADVCEGGPWKSDYSGRELCEHGRQDRHATEPCEHGEWKRHRTGESERTCYRCKGEGRADYGSKPIPVTVSPYHAYRVDADGTYLGLADKPYAPGNGYAPPKSKPASKHDVGGSLVSELRQVIPNVSADVTHPVTGGIAPLSTVIISLNDQHRWSRERIADWLETLDLDLRFPVGA